jgi:hypothetical protein
MGVQFDDQNYARVAPRRESGLYAFLLRTGIVQNHSQANLVLLGTVVLCFILMLVVIREQQNSHVNAPQLTPEDSYRAGNPSEIGNVPN